jgi:hypothetical protein
MTYWDRVENIWHPTSRWVRRHSKSLSLLLMAGIFSLLGWQLLRDWHKLPPGFFRSVRLSTLLASLAALLPALLLVSMRWGLTLRTMNVPVEWGSSIRIWFLSQAGRYIPGGVWTYVGRFYLGREEIPKEAMVTSMVLETELRVVSEMLAFLLSLPFWPDTGFLNVQNTFLLVGAVGMGLLLLHPAVLRRLGSTALAQRLGLSLNDVPGLHYGRILLLLAYYILSVILVGAAFYLLAAAFYPMPLQLLPPLIGSLALSVVLGFLMPLAPNGWGVREGVLAFLLSRLVPSPVAIVLSVVARIWLGLGEGAWILAMFLLHRGMKRDSPAE